ncbi:MAG TPA: hypothetical protein PK765_00100 [bacterium]|nr:hypothetical protein [bacterium]
MAADDVPMGGFSSVSGDTEPTVLSSKTNDSDSSESATKEMVSTQERASKDTTAAVSTSPVSSNESADRSVVADTPVDPTHGADSAMMVSDVTSSPEDLSRTVSNDAFSLSDLFAPPHDTVPSMDREYVVLVPSDIVDVYGLLPGTAKSYRSTGAVVPVPRALLGDFPVSSDLSLRFMTVADNEPYGLIYSIDVTNGSVFASKNEPLWNSNDSVVNGSGWQSEDEIVSQTDSFLQKFATLPVSFGSGVSLFEASSESVTIQYGMLIGGVEVYESYGVPRAATVSYDRAAKHVSGFSLPRIGGFSETEEVFVRPDVSLIESFIGNALFERGYDASQAYRISSLRMAYIASSDAEHPEIETFVPGIACSVVSEDGSLRETVTMPFGK